MGSKKRKPDSSSLLKNKKRDSSSSLLFSSWCLQPLLPFLRMFDVWMLSWCASSVRKSIFSQAVPHVVWTDNGACGFDKGLYEKIKAMDMHSPSLLVFPTNLTSLSFCNDRFDEPLAEDSLPSSLIKLRFYSCSMFNQSLEKNTLPLSLTYLDFGCWFNQPLEIGVLPMHLKELIFGNYFNQPLKKGVLPQSLTNIVFGYDFEQPIKDILPNNLRFIEFKNYRALELEPGYLPESLESIKLQKVFSSTLKTCVFPSNLSRLSLRSYSNIDRFSLPKKIRVLKLGIFQPLKPGMLPDSLTELAISSYVNAIVNVGALPRGLLSLDLGFTFNQLLVLGMLPDSLTKLSLGAHFNQELHKGDLPAKLLSLSLDWCFDKTLYPGVLPRNLTTLRLGFNYNLPLVEGVLPMSLKNLYLGKKFKHQGDNFVVGSNVVVDYR